MAVKSQVFRRHMRPQYNTRQILLKQYSKIGDFFMSRHLNQLFKRFSECTSSILPQSWIRAYLQMGTRESTFGIASRDKCFNNCDV